MRLQLELLKPQLELDARGIRSTVVLFGAPASPGPRRRRPNTDALRDMSRYYDEARRFARMIKNARVANDMHRERDRHRGGPGVVLEAGNTRAADAGGCSIGLNIVLPPK